MLNRRSKFAHAALIGGLLTGGLLMAGGGCTQGRAGDGSQGASSAAAAVSRDAWPFWPVRMRVHPLTRISRDAEGPVIDLRLEFFDESGDTTRCCGEAIIELAELPLDPASTASTISMQWNLDLRNLELNGTHFDDITRTYLIRLRPGDSEIPARSEVRVKLNGSNGAVLRASQRLQ